MSITKILSREHSATRFEIYQTDHSLWLYCHVCGYWLTDTEVKHGLIEIEGCECAERRIKVDDMLSGVGIVFTSSDDYIQFIKDIAVSAFPLGDLLNGQNVEDTPALYQWIAFWTGNYVLELELDFSVPL